MANKNWNLVAYDVHDGQRLRRVAKTLEGYGTRVQYSVFRCRLDRIELERLHWELSQIMEDVDDLLVIPLCTVCASKVPLHSSGDKSDWAEDAPTFRIV